MASEHSTNGDIEDPILREHVEHALAPYRDRLPPEDLPAFRDMLVEFYTHNPAAVSALNELRAAPVVDESGTVQRRGDAALEAAVLNGPRRRVPGGAR